MVNSCGNKYKQFTSIIYIDNEKIYCGDKYKHLLLSFTSNSFCNGCDGEFVRQRQIHQK
jgi:hypothetical protein